MLLGLVASGLVFFGRQFILFWAGAGYEDAYYVMLLLVLPASIALIQNLGIEIQRAQNKHHFRSLVYLGMAFVNLGLSIILCQKYGTVGCAIGTAASLVLSNGLIMNIYYHKKCAIDIIAFWKSIFRLFCGLLLPVAAGVLILRLADITHWGMFLIWVMVYTSIYCLSMWFIGMNSYEKQLVLKPIFKVLGRNKNDQH